MDKTTNLEAEIAALPFEAAREQLAQVVARLEAGGDPLETSLELWERGELLAAHCQSWLDKARQRLATATGGEAPVGESITGDEPF
ncbi:MAG: exodeoxyribonuclease VII small subunit [Cellulomonadaceae bacterium]|nr:exodeoxyribonuclease VII small subunit [Cellulomonadaceae bacterium]